MLNALIATGPGFEDTEFFYPFYRLQEENILVDVVISNDQTACGKYGIPAVPTIKIAEINRKEYDLLVIPGGHEAPDRVRQVKEILDLTYAMNEKDKIIASICHGPWVLVSAGIVKGRKLTCYKGCKDDIINAGGEWISKPVVVDGNIVTAQHYRDNPMWMREALRLLKDLNKDT